MPTSLTNLRSVILRLLTRDEGQATAEYALVMVAGATLAGLLIAWAAGTDGITRLMDAVITSLLSKVP